MRHRRVVTIVLTFALLSTGLLAYADKLVLKDGSTLEGTIIKRTEGYWIKLGDGTTRTVPFDKVKEWVKGSGAPGAAPAGGTPVAPTTPAAPTSPKPGPS